MAGISSKALKFGNPENKKNKFQNQELNDDLGVDMYEFKYRMDDPQIGRFWQIDPLADKYVHNSTYAFSENKVIAHVELEGLESMWVIDSKNPIDYTKAENRQAGLVLTKDVIILGITAFNPAAGVSLFLTDQLGVPTVPVAAPFTGAVTLANEASAGLNEVKTAAQEIKTGVGEVKTAAQEVKVGPYSNLKDPKTVGVGKDFTSTQKQAIINANKTNNGGVIKSDLSGQTADAAVQSKKGVPTNMNQAEVDHIIPKAKGGTNSNSNAQVLTKKENLKKGSN